MSRRFSVIAVVVAALVVALGMARVVTPTRPAASPATRSARSIDFDPRSKIVGFFAITLIAVSTPLPAWPVWVACGMALVLAAAVARVSARDVARRARVVLPLVVFVGVFVPFFRDGREAFPIGPLSVSFEGLRVLAEVTAKATIGTVSAVLLGLTTTVPAVIRGLEVMRVPRLLTLIAAFMYRYLFVIGDELRRMRSALAARGYRPRHLFAVAALGRMATALFLRSYSRGERVYLAMLARGYTGRCRVWRPCDSHGPTRFSSS